PRDLLKDTQVKRGLQVLAEALTDPPTPQTPNFIYFLFSMERVGVVYNVKKIGDHDWYAWGARKLVDSQDKDGSWTEGFPYEAADICFALLFLKRAKVALDLTEILEAPIHNGPRTKLPI